ncbi:CACTA en-spm transposon protein [Cucumis melo var. makuwa]|uniref:CACTA en-spm transposon protein n=1 Tax=Cucumis melo var. makuwa TaxID=1194695 RepID=A0A5D3DJ64_CUCMM|nr:CACTA en-spm transposon protein [Cucumis melo var. makuwa]
MLTVWKKFRGQNHRHFKKFNDPEQARPYNHNSSAKSLLQRQHKLTEQRDHLIDHVKLLKKTHARDGLFVSQATADAHNKMLKLQFQPTSEGSQPLSRDEICETVLGRQSGYSKCLGWALSQSLDTLLAVLHLHMSSESWPTSKRFEGVRNFHGTPA